MVLHLPDSGLPEEPSARGPSLATERRSHRLSARELELQGRLMVFNWLPAAYAHPDWLGALAPLLTPPGTASTRLVRRASVTLLEGAGLSGRWLSRVSQCPWVLFPAQSLRPIAEQLALAMLGGWVRNGLEREQVALQRQVLTPGQRAKAMEHANLLNALPYPEEPWPLAQPASQAVLVLGVSALVALLDEADGSQQRFALRWPRSALQALHLDQAQRQEARAILDVAVATHPPCEGPLDSAAESWFAS